MTRSGVIALSALLASAFPAVASANAATLYVGPAETYTTIQSAIDASSNGDMINVNVLAGGYSPREGVTGDAAGAVRNT